MSRKRWIIALLVIAVAVCVMSGVVVCRVIVGAVNYDAYEAAIQATERLLSYIREYPTDSLPLDELPSYLWVREDCWTLLQEAMIQNSGQYSLTARYNGIPYRPVDDILVRVDFADGRQVEVLFYQGGLVGCSEVHSE